MHSAVISLGMKRLWPQQVKTTAAFLRRYCKLSSSSFANLDVDFDAEILLLSFRTRFLFLFLLHNKCFNWKLITVSPL